MATVKPTTRFRELMARKTISILPAVGDPFSARIVAAEGYEAVMTSGNASAAMRLGIPDIGLLLISARDGRPVYVSDVASVVIGASPREHRVWNDARDAGAAWHRTPAVSVAIAKRAGANAVVVAED